MSAGLQLFNPDGQLVLDVSETITRFVGTFTAALTRAGPPVFISVPGMLPGRTVIVAMDGRLTYGQTQTRWTVSVGGFNAWATINAQSNPLVMRFKVFTS